MLSGSLVKRLNYVTEELSLIVERDFQTTLSEDYSDEIGRLSRIVNQMIRDIKKHIEDKYQSELKRKEYEFQALQAQINPHFLYNALSAANWHAIAAGNMETSAIVTMLAKFYRTALNKGERVTTVQNEMSNIKAYVEIQLLIHNHSFKVDYQIDRDAYPYFMPNLIIQPIVENAIEHGIDHLEGERGYLLVAVRASATDIAIEVANNGAPLKCPEKLLERESTGYGLSNVNKRLELFFGSRYDLRFEGGELTRVLLRFPRTEQSSPILEPPLS